MNVIDKLYTEWAWRTTSGTPDINNPEDKLILDNLLLELGVVFEAEEDEVQDETAELTKAELNEMLKAIDKIKEPYVRYLSVFAYFDNNSLGTISEVILTKLLQRTGIQASHTGASGGLADLYINGKPVSLKTTVGVTKIGLGNDQARINATDIDSVVKILNKLEPDSYTSILDLKNKIEPNLYKVLVNRVDSIAEKLAGPKNEEFFVWVEKIFDSKTKILTEFKIHVAKYDLQKVKNEMMKMKPYASSNSWGLKDPELGGKNAVTADAGSKYLNVEPNFVRKTTAETARSIKLIQPEDIEGLDRNVISQNITDALFDKLDDLYVSLGLNKAV